MIYKITCIVLDMKVSYLKRENSSRCEKFIIDNNFCLPSLEGTISENAWHQAHEVGHFAVALGLEHDMEEYLLKMRSETKDEDVIERVDALIRYALKF